MTFCHSKPKCLYFPPYNTKSFFFLHFHSLHLSIQKQCIATNWKKHKKWQGSVTSVWCHSWVLWQSPDTPDISCFYVSARLRVRSLICVPCFVLERGVRIPALLSWVSCRGSDTRAPCSVSFRSMWSRVRSAVCSSVHVCCVLWCCTQFVFYRLHAFMLYVVLCALCFSQAACFHVVMSCVNMPLMNILISCVFVSCFAHGWWFVLLAMGLCFCFVWAHDFFLSFKCDHDHTHLVSWLLVNLPHLSSLVTLLICSLYNLLVFAVLCQFVVECFLFLPCLALPCLGKPISCTIES